MVLFISIFAVSVAAVLFVQWVDVDGVQPTRQYKKMKHQPIKAQGKPSYAEAPAQAQRA